MACFSPQKIWFHITQGPGAPYWWDWARGYVQHERPASLYVTRDMRPLPLCSFCGDGDGHRKNTCPKKKAADAEAKAKELEGVAVGGPGFVVVPTGCPFEPTGQAGKAGKVKKAKKAKKGVAKGGPYGKRGNSYRSISYISTTGRYQVRLSRAPAALRTWHEGRGGKKGGFAGCYGTEKSALEALNGIKALFNTWMSNEPGSNGSLPLALEKWGDHAPHTVG